VAQFRGTQTFVVPAGAGSYAPQRLTFAKSNTDMGPVSLLAATALVTAAVTAAVIELWLLEFGGDPTSDADWFNTGKSITAAGSETWALAGWDGVQFRVKSGGTGGNLSLSGSAE
jgi:hypothetical protein